MELNYHDQQMTRDQPSSYFIRAYYRSQPYKDEMMNDEIENTDEPSDEYLTELVMSSKQTRKKFYPLHILTLLQPADLLSDYSTMSNSSFKQMLLQFCTIHFSSIPINDILHDDEQIACIRRLFYFIHRLTYSQLQYEQWSHYYNVGITEGIWYGRVSKKIARVNSMSSAYGRERKLIRERVNFYRKLQEEMTSTLQDYLQRISSHLLLNTDQWMTIGHAFVNDDQQQFRTEIQRRQQMHRFDAKDHQLVNHFYELKPRRDDIRSAQIIWRATQNEQTLRYEMALFQKWFSSYQQKVHVCTFEDLGLWKMSQLFTTIVFDKFLPLTSSTFTFVQNGNNIIGQFVRYLMQQTLSMAEKMARNYQRKVNEEKEKILRNRDRFTNFTNIETIFTVIEDRQQHMIQRALYIREQQFNCVSSSL